MRQLIELVIMYRSARQKQAVVTENKDPVLQAFLCSLALDKAQLVKMAGFAAESCTRAHGRYASTVLHSSPSP
jgi:hypothetical protein